MIDVSVIIVNYNQKELLHSCLQSVRLSTVSKEVFVYDNGSSDGSAELIRKEFPEVSLTCNRTNERFAKPNNDAMRTARGRYVFLLNNDVIVQPNALETLLTYMDSHPGVAMAGPQLRNPDGSVQPSCLGFFTLRTHLFDMLGLDRLLPASPYFAAGTMTYFDHKSTRTVDHVMAAALLVRREAIDTVGLMDEELSIYYNDLDWSLRFHRAGWKTVFVADAEVVHVGGATTKTMRFDPEIIDEQYANAMHYYEKHYGVRGLILYRVLLLMGFVPRTLFWLAYSIVTSSPETRWRLRYSLQSIRVAVSA